MLDGEEAAAGATVGTMAAWTGSALGEAATLGATGLSAAGLGATVLGEAVATAFCSAEAETVREKLEKEAEEEETPGCCDCWQ